MPIGHIASFLSWMFRREARRTADDAAAAQLAWGQSRRSADLPPGLEVAWLGAAGVRMSYQGHDLLIDPYVTRLSLADMLRRRVVPSAEDVVTAHVPRASAVLIGHTHFDHALDAPAIARRHGCPVYGSRSMTHLMQLHGLADRAVEVEPYRVYPIGPFEVTFVPSRHSKLTLGLKIPYHYDISCEHLDELTPQAYGCGQVWGIHIAVAGVTFYHQGSADLDDDAVRHRGVDYFLAGISGRRFTPRYWARVLGKLEPRVIVPTHFDNFFTPLTAPMAFSPNINLAGFADEIRAVSADFEIRALGLGEVIGSPPARP